MNHRMILFILSRVLLAEAVLLAGSACVGRCMERACC